MAFDDGAHRIVIGSSLDRLGQMEHLGEIIRFWTAIDIVRHDRCHVFPPFPANFCMRDQVPAFLAFNLNIGKEQVRTLVKKDSVGSHSMIEQEGLHLGPKLLMPSGIFRFFSRLNRHDEALAYYRWFYAVFHSVKVFFAWLLPHGEGC